MECLFGNEFGMAAAEDVENAVNCKLLGEPQSIKGAGKCPVCGKTTDKIITMARSY